MYESFYDLRSAPFTKGTPCKDLFMPKEFSEAVSRLEYVSKNQLFAVLTGDCGTGKSTILRKLSDTLDPRHYKMFYISDSQLTPRTFYRMLLEQLGVTAKWNRSDAKKQLHEQLAVLRAVDELNIVCVIDESHLLSYEMMEEIRFMMNMKFDSVNPVALILAGQTELWKKLMLQKFSAIRQRIDIQCSLNHYDRATTGSYIRHQLKSAGAEREIFTEAAIDQIFEYSSGIARIIDKVCTNVLIYGSQNRMQLIDDHAVKTVLDCEFR